MKLYNCAVGDIVELANGAVGVVIEGRTPWLVALDVWFEEAALVSGNAEIVVLDVVRKPPYSKKQAVEELGTRSRMLANGVPNATRTL